MFRTKTTLVIGPGAGRELEMPDDEERLKAIAESFDFSRLGSDLQTREMVALDKHFDRLAQHSGVAKKELQAAADAIRTSARIARNLDAILEQHENAPLVQAVGKLAVAFQTLQAEAASPLLEEPRDPGDLPMQGNENWLFQLGRMIVDGVPGADAERCFDNLSIINFNRERAAQHYLPWVVSIAFGKTLTQARQLVSANLRITHPVGHGGRLPWEEGDSAKVHWGEEDLFDIQDAITAVRTVSEAHDDDQLVRRMKKDLASSEHIVFLGFDFEPAQTSLLFSALLSHKPHILVAMKDLSAAREMMIRRMFRRQAGIDDENLITLVDTRPYKALQEYSLLLEI